MAQIWKHRIDPEVQAITDRLEKDFQELRDSFQVLKTLIADLQEDFKTLDTETNAIEPRINERFDQIEKTLSEGSLSVENSKPISTGVRVFTQRRHDRQMAASAVNEMAGRIQKVAAILPDSKEN